MPELKEPVVCETNCEHKDCKHWKQFVGTICDLCDKSVESNQAYYEDVIGKPKHADCVLKTVGNYITLSELKELDECEIELDDDGYCSVHYDGHIDIFEEDN